MAPHPHPNEALMHRAWLAVAQGDVDALRCLVTEKADWMATGDSPWAGRYEGFDQVVHLLARIGEELESFDANVIDILSSDARVLLLCHVSATIGKRTLDCDYLVFAKVEEARLASMWSCPMQPDALREFWSSLRDTTTINSSTC